METYTPMLVYVQRDYMTDDMYTMTVSEFLQKLGIDLETIPKRK